MDLPINEISPDLVALIGEYTTPSGPFGDDHFIVIVMNSGELLEFRAEESTEFATTFARATGVPIEFKLSNRTNYASRIMFPMAMAENELFRFRPRKQGVLRSIFRFGVTEIDAELTPEARAYIREQDQ